MNWKPIGDQVLMNFTKGVVEAMGNGLFTQTGDRIPMTVKPGDEVFVYKSNLGENKSIILDDIDYMLIRESEIGLVNSK